MVDIRSTPARRRRAEAALTVLGAQVAPLARERLGILEGDAFLARLEHEFLDIFEPIDLLYGDRADTAELVHDLVGLVLDAAVARPAPLRALDRRREIDRGWFQRSRMLGYVCYADRFAGSLAGVRQRLDYLG